jgi:NAD(P)-dependent dehydrogenase (short-subunit alcohol dehydrogenase family)
MPEPSRFLDRLAGKSSIVTGAGSPKETPGVGAATARMFAAEGARVCVVDRDAARATDTVDLIRQAGGEAIACEADITREDDCARIVASAIEHFGALDILVNNVGIAGKIAPLETLTQAEWDNVFDVNVRGATMLTRCALPHLTAAGRSSIVNIASVSGVVAHGTLAYGPSKAALISLTHELAIVYGKFGVRANAIAPGYLFAPMVREAFDARQCEIRRKIAPLGIEGDSWDVASAALFLASDDARFITSTCLPVDGGVSHLGGLAAIGLIE